MIRVNENLLDLSKMTYTKSSYDKNTKIAKVLDGYLYARLQFKLPEGLEVGKQYTFSCRINNIDGNSELEVCHYPNAIKRSLLKSDGSRQMYTFTLNEKNTHIYLYLGIPSHTKGSYKISYIKIEKGDRATPYIPNKNAIETAKRQYFIGGVRSKKYIQSNKILLGKGDGVC